MIRTQIQLTEQQNRLLRDIARNTHESIAALIRRAIDQFLMTRKPDRRALYRQASAIVGKYRGGVQNISLEHDSYLEEDFN